MKEGVAENIHSADVVERTREVDSSLRPVNAKISLTTIADAITLMAMISPGETRRMSNQRAGCFAKGGNSEKNRRVCPCCQFYALKINYNQNE